MIRTCVLHAVGTSFPSPSEEVLSLPSFVELSLLGFSFSVKAALFVGQSLHIAAWTWEG
jgi:hypothetical protein